MFGSVEENGFLVLALLVFVAVLLALEGLWVVWQSHQGPTAKRMKQRLMQVSGAPAAESQARLLKQRTLSQLPFIERKLRGLGLAQRLERLIKHSGLNWT